MGLLSNLKARLGRIGIDPNISIPPKLTPSLPRGPAIELPKIPRRRIGLPPRNISRIREDVGGIVERSLPVGEPIPFVPPTIQPDPMPTPMPISPPVLGKPIMQQPRPQPIGVPSLMDPRQPQPNLATGIIEPVSRPIQQLPQGPQPIPQEPIELETGPVTIGGPKNLSGVGPAPVLADNNPPTAFATINQPVQPIFTTDEPIDPANRIQIGNFNLEKMPFAPKRDDFMSIGGPGGGFDLDERDAIDSGVPTQTSLGERVVQPDGTITQALSASAPDYIPPSRDDFFTASGTAREPVNVPINAPMPMPTSVPEPVTTPTPVTTSAPVTPPEPVTPPASTTVAANQPAPAPVVEPAATTTATTNAGQEVNNPFAASVTQRQTTLDPITQQLLFGLDGQGGFIPGAMRAAEKTFYDDQGNPIVIDEQVAGFSPDQISAIEMQRQSLGLQDPYIQDARSALQASMQAYDPSITGQFFNPFEDRVVQQTIQDVMEQGAKSDIGALAGNIARGGQSAFGSRARLGAAERQEALGRGLSEALGSLRARGFSEAQRAGMGEFARQKAAQRAGASGIAGLGAQAAGASLSDIGALFGMGTQQQTQAQAMLDAQRRNLQQRQMTPLLQYQALQPFVSMAPSGTFQTDTQFVPAPSPMQAGLGAGLSAFGALGQLYGGK